MKLRQLVDVKRFPLFEDIKLWDRPVAGLTKMELAVLFDRLQKKYGYDTAKCNLLLLKQLIYDGLILQSSIVCPALAYTVPVKRLLSTEFAEMLNKMTLIRRQAFMFCMYTGMSGARVSTLTWKQAYLICKDKNVAPEALQLLKVIPRHIRTKLVFWEYHGSKVLPLAGFVAQWRGISGMGVDETKACFEDLIYVDNRSHEVEMILSNELRG
jgi:hypothetical protein